MIESETPPAPSNDPTNIDEEELEAWRRRHGTSGLGALETIPPETNETAIKCWDLFNTHLMGTIETEFTEQSISIMVQWYSLVASEFFALIEPQLDSVQRYATYLERLMKRLEYLYSFKRIVMLAEVHRYDTEQWGDVFWRFLHLTSILLAHAYQTKRIRSMMNLVLIVHHIDFILPCGRCVAHYRTIKYGTAIHGALKLIAFGECIRGLQVFHELITRNVASTTERINAPPPIPFLMADFAFTYGCIDLRNETRRKTSNYVTPTIDWQPKTHALLSTLLSAYCGQLYSRASALLKMRFYPHSGRTGLMPPTIEFPVLMYYNRDEAFFRLGPNQIAFCLMRIMTLQLTDTVFDQETAREYHTMTTAVRRIHLAHPRLIMALTRFITEPNHQTTVRKYMEKLDDQFQQWKKIARPLHVDRELAAVEAAKHTIQMMKPKKRPHPFNPETDAKIKYQKLEDSQLLDGRVPVNQKLDQSAHQNRLKDLPAQQSRLTDLPAQTNRLKDLSAQKNGLKDLSVQKNGLKDQPAQTRKSGTIDPATQKTALMEQPTRKNGITDPAVHKNDLKDRLAQRDESTDQATQKNGLPTDQPVQKNEVMVFRPTHKDGLMILQSIPKNELSLLLDPHQVFTSNPDNR